MRHSDHGSTLKVEQVENGYVVTYSEVISTKSKVFNTWDKVVEFMGRFYGEANHAE